MADRPHARYSVRHFVEDEARLLPSGTTTARARWIDAPDGRLLPLPTRRLREALADAWEAFERKYGREVGADHLERFRLVLEFVATHDDEMRSAGLAAGGNPPAIREEFLEYLLNCEVRSGAARIPETALGRFLDEWGTRWI